MVKKAIKAVIPYGLLVLYKRIRVYLSEYRSRNQTVDQAKFRELLAAAKPISNTDDPGTIVSLTSYGHRITKTAPLAIASLFNQTVLPDKIILWLAHGEKISRDLKRLTRLGLEIRFTEDIKSYKKLIPSLKMFPGSSIITADDDTIYPNDLIYKLVAEHKKHPVNIITHRARGIVIVNKMPATYEEWPIIEDSKQNFISTLPIGVGGVLYPPNSLDSRVLDEDIFSRLAPQGDDLWFWAMGELSNTKKTIVKDGYIDVIELDPEGGMWLTANSQQGDGNDAQFIDILKYFPDLCKSITSQESLDTVDVRHDKLTSRFNLTNRNDWITKIQIKTGTFYEIEMLKDVQNRLSGNEGNVIIDAGTYIGNHTVFFAQHCNADKVISFEPFKESYDKLMANIKLNHLEDKIDSYNIGLGDARGAADVDIVDSNNQGANKMDLKEKGQITIDTLDSVLYKKLTRLDCIKIDVEGMEVPLIKGALKIINKFSPLIYVEAFEQERLNDIIRILAPLGYRAADVFNATPTYLFVRESYENKR